MPSNGRAIAAFSSALVGNNYVNLRVIARERAGEEHKRPHPEEAAHRSRACPTSATLKCRNRQQPISMRGRPEAREGRRMDPGIDSFHPSRRAAKAALLRMRPMFGPAPTCLVRSEATASLETAPNANATNVGYAPNNRR